MYKIIFKTGKELEIQNKKYFFICDLKQRGMLNKRQQDWLNQVKQVIYIRNSHTSLQAHRIHQTKDIFESDCVGCQRDAKKYRDTYWKDDD